MAPYLKMALCLLLLNGSLLLTAQQQNKELALVKAHEAIDLMDAGKIKASIKLLKEAQKLDADNPDITYEIAYAHYLQKDFKEAIKVVETIVSHPKAIDRYFQMLGNCYDFIGNSSKAIEVYESGLKKFPKSGKLYLEIGNVYFHKEKYENALSYYEKGISVDPSFSSNYYRAARILCFSTEKIWGLIYAEIFMNLERNTARTEDMSRLMAETYKMAIQVDKDTASVSFCRNMIVAPDDSLDLDTKKMKIPFCLQFESIWALAYPLFASPNIDNVITGRVNFLKEFVKTDTHKNNPLVVYSFQQKLEKQGFLIPYNYWLLMRGDESAFVEWRSKNEDQWKNFVAWFSENPLQMDQSNTTLRLRY